MQNTVQCGSTVDLDFANKQGFTQVQPGIFRYNKYVKVIALDMGKYRRYDGGVFKDYSNFCEAILGK